MTIPSSSHHSSQFEIDALVDGACREFERKFHDDPQFRIEHFLNEGWKQFPPRVDPERVKHQVVAELIFVEMEMRWVGGQPLDAGEYFGRFPNFSQPIEESLRRLRAKHRSFHETCSLINVSAGDVNGDDSFELQIGPPLDPGLPPVLGPFREITQIKSGSFGIVCRAIDSRNGRAVALKFPRREKFRHDPELRSFFAEASKAMLLDHPGIVRTYAIERSGGYLAIVQQFIDGTDLAAIRDQIRDHRQIALLVAKITDAVAHAHQKGIFHRDLKPANILIDHEGRPYVGDFGLAILDCDQIYLPSQRCGTAAYMPPEQVEGLTRLLDGRSDIWSIGVILYELLTKRRPFRGITESDIYAQIETKDPQPPRQIDISIPAELQRICLKCLERQQRDRYLTADELAEDLRHWAGQSGAVAEPKAPPLPFMPKGLRSYSAEDASYFLDLLPGPRDRDGLPGSIRFWKSRICEPVLDHHRVPVGVIFGPSGSGKSSFLKAGLLSQLGDGVLTVYVEATQADTEVRLLKALRQRLEGVPDRVSLPQLFRGISRGQWRPAAFRKVLIVIDQFEQRLSLGDDFSISQLAKALRFCEGQQLQCLLLTRDDFMMALSRFADALEMDLREGDNAQAIDLFDKKHARKVLAKLGRAYEQLPPESEELTAEQESFLEEAVDQLAHDDHVICVHLALFAEMFRHRPWTPSELKLVGGVAGTGERFLEATFGPNSRDKRHRLQREPAQRVLETLLPAAGTDIRGAMKPEAELMAAAKMEKLPTQFGDLIKTLDVQLKLITRTDPDQPVYLNLQREDQDDSGSAGGSGWYQLTHDYLIPTVRNWLDRSLGKSRSGRAKLRLRNLGAQVIPGHPPTNLPTYIEWLAWQFQIPRLELNDNERVVMRQTRRRFFRHSGAVLLVFLLFSILTTSVLLKNSAVQKTAEAKRLISDLLTFTADEVTPGLAKLKPHSNAITPEIERLLSSENVVHRLRASYAVIEFSNSQRSDIIRDIVALSDDVNRSEFKNIVRALKKWPELSDASLRTAFEHTKSATYATKLAIIEMTLGKASLLETIASNWTYPDSVTEFMLGFGDWYEGGLDFRQLFKTQLSPNGAFALTIALGRIPKSRFSESEFISLRSILEQQYLDHADSGVHSAALWALQKWEIDPPTLQSDPSPPVDRDWWVLPLGSFKTELARVRPGEFKRGEGGDASLMFNWYPAENVKLDDEFWISTHEVPHELVRQWIASNESNIAEIEETEGNVSCHNLSFLEAAQFTNWLTRSAIAGNNSSTPGLVCYEPRGEDMVLLRGVAGIRLPTPDEWEFACRAGSRTRFPWGNKSDVAIAREFGVIDDGSLSDIAPVASGTRIPNRLGIFDMIGNVSELSRGYEDQETGHKRCFRRGGSCRTSLRMLAVGHVVDNEPNDKTTHQGIRIVVQSKSER